MTYPEFDTQMQRLTSTYGPKAYPDERKRLLWDEFKSVEARAFERVVSQLIGENSMAPMLSKFRELMATQRERLVLVEKREHREAALNFHNGFDREETKVIVAGIHAILAERNRERRHRMVDEHCRFIENLARAKRGQK